MAAVFVVTDEESRVCGYYCGDEKALWNAFHTETHKVDLVELPNSHPLADIVRRLSAKV
ncbi:MAG TPA: hypothetical protein VJ742_13285 [Nitrososphaera sp.]|nr:hypothetical protein [Nitrososphaera sp.]